MQPETPVEKAILENRMSLFAICDEQDSVFEYWIAGLYRSGDIPEGLRLAHLSGGRLGDVLLRGDFPAAEFLLSEYPVGQKAAQDVAINAEYKAAAGKLFIRAVHCLNQVHTQIGDRIYAEDFQAMHARIPSILLIRRSKSLRLLLKPSAARKPFQINHATNEPVQIHGKPYVQHSELRKKPSKEITAAEPTGPHHCKGYNHGKPNISGRFQRI